MISFPFKNEAPISANSAHDDPVSFRLGNGECFGAIEQCSMQQNIGERAYFDISSNHPDFYKLLASNKWTVTEEEITKDFTKYRYN